MSCFIVNNKTASSIVTALIHMAHIHESEAQTLLNMMMVVNAQSMHARYNDNITAPQYAFEKQDIGFNGEDVYLSMMQMITNIAFFKYQSCEFEGCQNTLVFKTLQHLQDELLSHFKDWCVANEFYSADEIKSLPYDKLPYSDRVSWGLDD